MNKLTGAWLKNPELELLQLSIDRGKRRKLLVDFRRMTDHEQSPPPKYEAKFRQVAGREIIESSLDVQHPLPHEYMCRSFYDTIDNAL